ncbi:RNA polymerase sigma factor [Turicibacter sanguinis]|uniref:RNA polymerase sigma factor n=1 Tax=Turicibacter sanguinis TaxID=154288 RepID=UPI00232C4354|nr:sigma-70 family RNA polymerase sigma factor [Turicibacter sanguinis]MDB8576146.1 sigma-70 family RNA polymerase sigma factor [Turicibacter sanguinis]MDB8578963.1 sigma-70 family RNA polymerase sigma factor [Turicibacter sanguinis]MDB8584802.1 sigma-70 family RNA polymerase sigma factor [Turicibacter sanguinis]MDB8587855.1 sigma-70 family RNA polymerase sigma factor [Turicibacter sanguinis]MDB8598537.1 sigma-70 family RNA polymerase sigma factor [Turicibacter sanguinis]
MKKDTYQSAQMVVERLIEDYGQDVLKIAYLYVKDQQLAEDIFQEVFYKVMKNYHKFEHLSNEKTWLIRITINTCKDLLRTSWLRRVTTFGTLEEQNQTQYEQPFDMTQSESNNELYEMIMKLPQRYKEVILLFYYEDFSYDEMAKILNIPKGTVQSRLARGREKLKKMMEERGEISGR